MENIANGFGLQINQEKNKIYDVESNREFKTK
jgi:hypothetical protein